MAMMVPSRVVKVRSPRLMVSWVHAHSVGLDDPNNPSRFDERRRSYHTPDETGGISPPGDGDGPDLTNPLTATPSRFCMSESNGQPCEFFILESAPHNTQLIQA